MVNIYAAFTDLYPNKEPGMGTEQLPRAPCSGREVVPEGRAPHPCKQHPCGRKSSASHHCHHETQRLNAPAEHQGAKPLTVYEKLREDEEIRT